MSRGAAVTGRVGALQREVRGEALGSGFCLDLGYSGVVLVLRQPYLLTQAHPQVGNILKIKIHIEGVWCSGLIDPSQRLALD